MFEILYTPGNQTPDNGRPIKSAAIPVDGVSWTGLVPGMGTRIEHFGLELPDAQQKFQMTTGELFERIMLSTEREGQGDLVNCWMRIA